MALTSHTPPSAFSILFMSPSVCSCAWLRGPSCGAAASEAPARRARRTAPVELRRADVNAAWQKPPWLHQKQALLTDFETPALYDGLPADAVVTVELEVEPVGGGFWARGDATISPHPLLACATCGALHTAPLSASFDVWLTDKLERERSRKQNGRRGAAAGAGKPVRESTAAASDAADTLLFPAHANSVDLSPVVRDCLLLALPVASTCELCERPTGSVVVAQASVGAGGTPGGAFAMLAPLRDGAPRHSG